METNGGVISKMILWAAFSAEVYVAMYELRWMIAFALILIIADLYWGSRDAISVRREKWHLSQAGRRTFSKIIEYMTYLLLGCVGGLAILEPIGICNHIISAAVGLGCGSLFEVSSIIGHVLMVHGIKKRFNLWTFLVSLLKSKRREVGEAIEGAVEDEENDKQL